MSYNSKLKELADKIAALSAEEKTNIFADVIGWYAAEACFVDDGVHMTMAHTISVEMFIRSLRESIDRAKEESSDD